jgi:tRNA threonylcarbamoyladenosine biosynthesis protein TsaE
MSQEWIFSLSEIDKAALAFLEWRGDRRVFALHGEMGAGKTTLVQAVCRAMGVKDAMSSPTYALVNHYEAPGFGPVLHMDLYRLADAEEGRDAGIEEQLHSGAFCFVEWPLRAPELLPDDAAYLRLEVLEDGRRRLVASDPA